MTSANGTAPDGDLDAIRRLERTLDQRDVARESADETLSAARAKAEHLSERARVAGTRAGRRRHAELLAEADAQAAAIREAGEDRAHELLERTADARDDLSAELLTLLLPGHGR